MISTPAPPAAVINSHDTYIGSYMKLTIPRTWGHNLLFPPYRVHVFLRSRILPHRGFSPLNLHPETLNPKPVEGLASLVCSLFRQFHKQVRLNVAYVLFLLLLPAIVVIPFI